MEYFAQTLNVSHNDISHAARIALYALGKSIDDSDIYLFAENTTCWWSSIIDLEVYVADWAKSQ